MNIDVEKLPNLLNEAVASGEESAANEKNDFQEIAIFKSGVTL